MGIGSLFFSKFVFVHAYTEAGSANKELEFQQPIFLHITCSIEFIFKQFYPLSFVTTPSELNIWVLELGEEYPDGQQP